MDRGLRPAKECETPIAIITDKLIDFFRIIIMEQIFGLFAYLWFKNEPKFKGWKIWDNKPREL